MTDRTLTAPERADVDAVADPPVRRRVVLVVAGVVLAGLAVALLPLLLLLVQHPAAPAAQPASSASPRGESSTLPKLTYDPRTLTSDLAAAAGTDGAVTKAQLLFHSGDGERDGATAGISGCVADGAGSRAAVFTLAHEGGAWVVTKRTWSAAQTC